jgi:hypothetical protein
MSDNLFNGMVTVAMAIVGVAIIAVLVSKNANTANVITSVGKSISSAINAATSPVGGGSFQNGFTA